MSLSCPIYWLHSTLFPFRCKTTRLSCRWSTLCFIQTASTLQQIMTWHTLCSAWPTPALSFRRWAFWREWAHMCQGVLLLSYILNIYLLLALPLIQRLTYCKSSSLLDGPSGQTVIILMTCQLLVFLDEHMLNVHIIPGGSAFHLEWSPVEGICCPAGGMSTWMLVFITFVCISSPALWMCSTVPLF